MTSLKEIINEIQNTQLNINDNVNKIRRDCLQYYIDFKLNFQLFDKNVIDKLNITNQEKEHMKKYREFYDNKIRIRVLTISGKKNIYNLLSNFIKYNNFDIEFNYEGKFYFFELPRIYPNNFFIFDKKIANNMIPETNIKDNILPKHDVKIQLDTFVNYSLIYDAYAKNTVLLERCLEINSIIIERLDVKNNYNKKYILNTLCQLIYILIYFDNHRTFTTSSDDMKKFDNFDDYMDFLDKDKNKIYINVSDYALGFKHSDDYEYKIFINLLKIAYKFVNPKKININYYKLHTLFNYDDNKIMNNIKNLF